LENEKIFEILEEFEETRDEYKLLEDIRKIYNEEIKYTFQNIDFPTKNETTNQEEESSINKGKRGKSKLSVNTGKEYLKNQAPATTQNSASPGNEAADVRFFDNSLVKLSFRKLSYKEETTDTEKEQSS
jgi:hypothetical protein